MPDKSTVLFVNVGERAFLTMQNNLNITNQNRIIPQQDVNHTHLFRAGPADMNTVILTIKNLKNTNSAVQMGLHFGTSKIPYPLRSHTLLQSSTHRLLLENSLPCGNTRPSYLSIKTETGGT